MEYTNKDRASLYGKIAAIAGEIGAVSRDKVNLAGGRFKYVSWEEVVGAVNKKLKEYKVAIIPSVTRWESTPNSKGNPSSWRVELDVLIGDGETGYQTIVKWVGAADTPSDKGLQAAITNGMKYFYIKTFAIEVVDVDSDDDTASEEEHQGEQRNTPQVSGQPTPPHLLNGNGSAPQKPAVQQSQPATQSAERPLEKPAPKLAPSSIPSNHNAETFMTAIKELGLDNQSAIEILKRFGNKANAQGKFYEPPKHEALINQIAAYVKFEQALRATGMAATVAGELQYLGINEPYTADAVLTAVPLVESHAAFSKAANAITPDASEVLGRAGLLPWRPEKQELMLQTLRSHVSPPFELSNKAPEIVEKGSIDEVAVGDFDDSLASFANATGAF